MTTLNLTDLNAIHPNDSQNAAPRPYQANEVLNYAFPAAMVRRLQAEQGWPPHHTGRVLQEYRRFLHLAATAPHPVTPSRVVDEAWHLHLTFTRDYWQKLTPLLPAELHHEPASGEPGDAQESAQYRDQYARTLETYRVTFGEDAPSDVWPHPAEAGQAALPTAGKAPGGQSRKPGRRRRAWGFSLAGVLLGGLTLWLTSSLWLAGILLGLLLVLGLVSSAQAQLGRKGNGGDGGSAGGLYAGDFSGEACNDSSGDGSCDSSGDGGGDGGSSCGGGCGGGCGS